jgi:hypothetical protein
VSTTIEHTCRPAGDGRRALNLEHERDCNLSGCPGCKPCEPRWGHCTRCKAEHLDADHPRTCARCVGKVRHDILEIGDQITEAHQQQVYRAVGSIAFMLTAPAGNYEAGMYVHQSAMSGRLCRCRQRGLPACLGDLPPAIGPVCDRPCTHPSCYAIRKPPACPDRTFILEELRLDEMHPFTVFGAWELHWRQLQDQGPTETEDTTLQSAGADHTTWSSARYLLENLTRMSQAPEEESDFAQLAHEVSASRRWLEDVLRLGDRPDRGVKCPVCGQCDLVKVYDTTDEGAARHDEARLTKEYDDLWTCTNAACAQTWTEAEYREKVQGIYLQKADRLTASQIRETYRVPEGSTRGWASKGLVKKRGKDVAGRQLYDVEDALRQRDRTAS